MYKPLRTIRAKGGGWLLVVLFAAAIIPINLYAQKIDSTRGLNRLKFLLGEWEGESGINTAGKGNGGFTFSMDLQNHVMIRRNFSEYPAMNGQPALRHEDLMVLYQLPGDTLRANFFDNEGHVINYDVNPAKDNKSVVFVSRISAPGRRYRLTLARVDDNNMTIKFEIALPADRNRFTTYIDAKAHKK